MGYLYDVYEHGSILWRGVTAKQIEDTLGIRHKYVKDYVKQAHRYKGIYSIVPSGDAPAIEKAASTLRGEYAGFECQWKQAVAPFKKVRWSRSGGKKLHVKRYEER